MVDVLNPGQLQVITCYTRFTTRAPRAVVGRNVRRAPYPDTHRYRHLPQMLN